MILQPPDCVRNPELSSKSFQDHISMQLSFTIKAIWNLRNQAEHKGAKVNFLAPIQALRHWIIEPAIALQTQKDHLSKDLTVWTKPPIETFKLNVDAAISVDYAALAVAAIDEKGEI